MSCVKNSFFLSQSSEIQSSKIQCQECSHILSKYSNIDISKEIFRKIGSASYTQLCEALPNIFNEKYCEYRNNGDSLSYIQSFFLNRYNLIFRNGSIRRNSNNSLLSSSNKVFNFDLSEDTYTFDDCVPLYSNFVSATLLTSEIKNKCKLRYILIKEIIEEDNNFNFFKELINSSQTYNSPELKYGDIFFISIITTVLIIVLIKVLSLKNII